MVRSVSGCWINSSVSLAFLTAISSSATFSEMFEINENSFLIDTPGFKEFQFYGIEKNEIKYTFPEFNKLRDKCKFNNCNHEKEPNCNVKKNIDKTIWRKRYTSYLTIIKSL